MCEKVSSTFTSTILNAIKPAAIAKDVITIISLSFKQHKNKH